MIVGVIKQVWGTCHVIILSENQIQTLKVSIADQPTWCYVGMASMVGVYPSKPLGYLETWIIELG
jgi:hypothetical protein